MAELPFRAFGKTHRFTSRGPNPSVVVTEKIDGTNGCVVVESDGTVHADSRARRLVTVRQGSIAVPHGVDNFGFGAWVTAHASTLRAAAPGHYYGEWFGSGIQRGYGLTTRHFVTFHRQLPDCPKYVGLVPVIGVFNTLDPAELAKLCAGLTCSALVPGYDNPEGIVAQHVPSGARFKILR